jgi:hypothetical protein
MSQRTIRGFVLVASLLVGRSALAIPAFARAHDYSCNVCHAPVPKLTEFGEEFAGNAFAPSDAPLPPRYFKDVGDDRLSLPRVFPLAVRGDLFLDLRANDAAKGDGFADLKTPFGLKLLSGGRIAKDIGYYFYFFMSERGEVAGIEDAYLHFNNLFGTPIDVLVGQFQISDPLFKRELRLTFQDYLLYRFRPGESGFDLTYDRGLMVSADFAFGLTVTGMVVNGNGKDEADLRKDLDLDRYKHGGLRLSQTLGPVRLGVVGYYGREQKQVGNVTRNNYTTVVGPDATVAWGPLELNLQHLYRWDANPGFDPRGQWEKVDGRGFMAELTARLWGDPGRLYAVVLFNYVESLEKVTVEPGSEAAVAQAGNQEAYTVNLTYLLHTNVKAMAEYTFGWVVDGRQVEDHRVTLGLMAAM